MKAAVMRTYGGVSVLKVDEFDLPYELDDTEVLVEVRVRYDTKKSLMTHIRHPLACAYAPVHASSVNRSLKFSY